MSGGEWERHRRVSYSRANEAAINFALSSFVLSAVARFPTRRQESCKRKIILKGLLLDFPAFEQETSHRLLLQLYFINESSPLEILLSLIMPMI